MSSGASSGGARKSPRKKGKRRQQELPGVPDDNDEVSIPMTRMSRQPVDDADSSSEYEDDMAEEADMVLTITRPVCITMLLVILLVKGITVPNIGLSPGQVLVYQEDSSPQDTGQQITGAIVTAAIVLVAVLVATTVFILLYKYRCLKLIFAWLITAAGSLLAIFGGVGFYLFLRTMNWPFDWFTLAFLLFNFAVVGVVSIFWYAPPRLQQSYLVIISVLMAAALAQLPEWTTWVLLGLIAVYDIFAVLCPKGPLKVLVDTATERNETIPALLYSAAVWIMMVNSDDFPPTKKKSSSSKKSSKKAAANNDDDDDDEETSDSEDEIDAGADRAAAAARRRKKKAAADAEAARAEAAAAAAPSRLPRAAMSRAVLEQREQRKRHRREGDGGGDSSRAERGRRGGDGDGDMQTLAPERRKGIQLGLGDFVFYSVLVGRAALTDMLAVYTCFLAIIAGLFMTLMLLGVFKRALPALPISIFLGMIFYFLTEIFLLPMVESMGRAGIFI